MANRVFPYIKSAAPTVNDDTGDGYKVGDIWLDTTNDLIYQAIDVTAGAAVWIEKVGRTLTQTLTNKTLTTPTIADFTNAQHTHTNAAGGGVISTSIMPISSLDGLKLSNNGTDANNDIDIATGRCADATGAVEMTLASALTKQLDAAWAVGTNQGGLDTGAKANSTWYHVWVIKRSDTGVVDVLFSTSASSPTMPTNYNYKRRIGAIRTNSSGNIIAFLQYNDEFLWKSPAALDVDTSTLGATRTNYTLTNVPSGIVVIANINAHINAASVPQVYISNPNLTDLTPSVTATPLALIGTSASSSGPIANIKVYTDTSAQISARSNVASTTFRVAVLGWVDPRGKW